MVCECKKLTDKFLHSSWRPSVFNYQLRALSSLTKNKILIDNLNALHKARDAYVLSEISEKICRVLYRNLRTGGYIKYVKHFSERWWTGPGKVLGQDRQQVLLKFGSNYLRVHFCRLAVDCNHDKKDYKASVTLTLTVIYRSNQRKEFLEILMKTVMKN